MKITEVPENLVGAAEAAYALLTTEGVNLTLLEGRVQLALVDGRLVVYRRGEAMTAPGVAATVEEKPRLLLVDDYSPSPDIINGRSGKPCYAVTKGEKHYYGDNKCCICLNDCCNDTKGECSCLTCEDPNHDHV